MTAASPAQNPPATVTASGDVGNASGGATTENSTTTAPSTRPPTVGESPNATDPPTPGLITSVIRIVWNDPHLRICKFSYPRPLYGELLVNHRRRVHSIILPDCGQSARHVVLSPLSGYGCRVFHVLAAPNCTCGCDGTEFGFDR